jgi:hypothetical protein
MKGAPARNLVVGISAVGLTRMSMSCHYELPRADAAHDCREGRASLRPRSA